MDEFQELFTLQQQSLEEKKSNGLKRKQDDGQSSRMKTKTSGGKNLEVEDPVLLGSRGSELKN